MKSKVKILVNGAVATLLTGAVASGLILSSAGAFQSKEKAVLTAREMETETVDISAEQETQAEEWAELISPDRYQLGLLWEYEQAQEQSKAAKETQEDGEKEQQSDAASAGSPLTAYFTAKALVNPDAVETCLNVRAQADENAEIVNTIRGQELVTVLDRQDEWTEIAVDGMEGWVKSEFLLTGEEAAAYMAEEGTPYARVVVSNMNIRLRPSTSADILDVAYADDAYEVCLLESGWVYAVYDGPMKGYLSADCLALSYSLGETWINTDIPFTETNARQLGITVSESSADSVFDLAASGNQSADQTQSLGQEDFLTVVMPTQTVSEETFYQSQSAEQSAGSGQDMQQPSSEEPSSQPTQPQTEPTTPQSQPTEPSSQPTQPQTEPTQPSFTAPVLTAIEAFYTGTTKTEGEVVYSSEIYLMAAYSDGSFATITEGWASNDIGMMLHAGENILTFFYGGLSCVKVIDAVPVSTTVPETQPSAPETQPTEPPTQPTQPTEPETQPTEPPTQSTEPTGCIRVSNVPLSSELTQYTLNLCSQYGVDSSVIFSVMYHESRFNANATSGSGAQGLMQIIPRYSAERMARLGVSNLYDPASNILVGIDLLAEYYHTYGSWNQALTMYRTGTAGSNSSYASTILGSICLFQNIYYE